MARAVISTHVRMTVQPASVRMCGTGDLRTRSDYGLTTAHSDDSKCAKVRSNYF